jgi:hypothetical protein
MASPASIQTKEFELWVETLGETAQALRNLEKEYVSNYKIAEKNVQGLKRLIGLRKEDKALLQGYINSMAKLVKEQDKEFKIQEKMRKTVEYTSKGLKGYIKYANDLSKSLKGVTDACMGTVAAFGVQAITWNGLVKTTLDYNKSLFNLTRSQNITGKGMKDIGKTLDYVKKETKMSQMQFLQLSNSMLSGFAGVKPDLKNIAELLGAWGEQMGYDYDSAKLLFELQSQFPPLFNKMSQGLDIIRKINKDQSVNSIQKNQLKGIQDQVIAYGLLNDVSMENINQLVAGLTPLTAQEKEYNELLKQRADLSKSAADLELDFAKQFEPLQKELLKDATAIIKVMGEFPNITIGIASAAAATGLLVTGLETAAVASAALGISLTAATGGLILIPAALATIGVLASKWVRDSRASEEAVKRITTQQRLQVKMQQEIGSLSGVRLREYNKQIDASKKEGDTLDDIVKKHNDAYKSVTQQGAETIILANEFNEIRRTVEGYEKGISATTSALHTTVDITEEFGSRAQEALKSLIMMSELDLSVSMDKFNSSLRLAANLLTTMGGGKIKLDIAGNIDDQLKAIQGVLQQVKNAELTDKQRVEINNALKNVMADMEQIQKKQANVIRSNTSSVEAQMRQQEKMTSLAESRLATERQLLESAQFGLGPSVEMMQRQVSLADKLQKGYAKTLQQEREMAQTMGKVTVLELQRIENAETAEEAEDLIRKTMGKTGDAALVLTQHWGKYQKISENVMRQQQKIYDLTKDIREGYLDAIREMSVGAGEFEKIIGLQDMGVTQLMGAVKDVTGVAKLNTMALGGLQEKVLTTSGVGAEYTGQYTTGGVNFPGAGRQREMNNRIYKYGESMAAADAAIKGNAPIKASTVGTGNVPGAENYLGPTREDLKSEGVVIGQEAGKIIANTIRDYTGAVNIGVRSGSFSKGEVAGIRAGGGGGIGAGTMGAGLLRSSQAPQGRDGGFVPGIGRLPYPDELTKGGSAGSGTSKVSDTTKEVKKLSSLGKKDIDLYSAQMKAYKGLTEAKNELQSAEAAARQESGKYLSKFASSFSKKKDVDAQRKVIEAYKKAEKAKEKVDKAQAEVGAAEKQAQSIESTDLKSYAAAEKEYRALKEEALTNEKNRMAIEEERKNVKDSLFTSLRDKAKKDLELEKGLKATESKGKELAQKMDVKQKQLNPSNWQTNPFTGEREEKIGAEVNIPKSIQESQKASKKAAFLKSMVDESHDAAWGIESTERHKQEDEVKKQELENLSKQRKANVTRRHEQLKRGIFIKGEKVSGYGVTAAPEGTTSTANIGGDQAATEKAMRVEALTKAIGVVKPKKGETQGMAAYKKATMLYNKEHVEELAEKDFKNAMEAKEALKTQKGAKGAQFRAGTIEAQTKTGGSAAEKGGYGASAAQEQAYMASGQQRSDIYGAEDGGGGGGSGSAHIVIDLAPGLKATIQDAANVGIEVNEGASTAV